MEICRIFAKEHPGATEADFYNLILRAGNENEYAVVGPNSLLKNGKEEIFPWVQRERERVKQLKETAEQQYPNLQLFPSRMPSGWVQLDTKAVNHTENLGRIYINPKITTRRQEHVADIFRDLASSFNQQPGLLQSIKMIDYDQLIPSALFTEPLPFPGPEQDTPDKILSRRDRIVVFFDNTKRAEVLEFMKQFYKGTYEPMVYENDAPLFTEQIQGVLPGGIASVLWGMGVADDPRRIEGEIERSRNQTIAAALFRAVTETAGNVDSAIFETAFKDHLRYFGIDPENPARNRGDEELPPQHQTDRVQTNVVTVKDVSDEPVPTEEGRRKFRINLRPSWIFNRKKAA